MLEKFTSALQTAGSVIAEACSDVANAAGRAVDGTIYFAHGVVYDRTPSPTVVNLTFDEIGEIEGEADMTFSLTDYLVKNMPAISLENLKAMDTSAKSAMFQTAKSSVPEVYLEILYNKNLMDITLTEIENKKSLGEVNPAFTNTFGFEVQEYLVRLALAKEFITYAMASLDTMKKSKSKAKKH